MSEPRLGPRNRAGCRRLSSTLLTNCSPRATPPRGSSGSLWDDAGSGRAVRAQTRLPRLHECLPALPRARASPWLQPWISVAADETPGPQESRALGTIWAPLRACPGSEHHPLDVPKPRSAPRQFRGSTHACSRALAEHLRGALGRSIAFDSCEQRQTTGTNEHEDRCAVQSRGHGLIHSRRGLSRRISKGRGPDAGQYEFTADLSRVGRIEYLTVEHRWTRTTNGSWVVDMGFDLRKRVKLPVVDPCEY